METIIVNKIENIAFTVIWDIIAAKISLTLYYDALPMLKENASDGRMLIVFCSIGLALSIFMSIKRFMQYQMFAEAESLIREQEKQGAEILLIENEEEYQELMQKLKEAKKGTQEDDDN